MERDDEYVPFARFAAYNKKYKRAEIFFTKNS